MKRGMLLGLGVCGLGVLAAMFGFANAQQEVRGLADDAPVAKVYEVSDLVHQIGDQPNRTSVVPPTRLDSSDYGDRGTVTVSGGGLFGNEDQGRPAGQGSAAIYDAIRSSVGRGSWLPEGKVGSIAYIESSGTFVIRQTPANHKVIKELIDELRDRRADRPMIALVAQWVVIDEDDFSRLAGGGLSMQPPPLEIDAAAVEKLELTPAARGEVTCFSGQTTHISSGKVQSVIIDVEPVVADGIATTRPIVRMVQWGAVLELTPTLSPDGQKVTVDLNSVLSEPRELGKIPLTAEKALATAGVSPPPPNLDRLDFDLCAIRTTVRIPAGKSCIVGWIGTFGKNETESIYLIVQAVPSK